MHALSKYIYFMFETKNSCNIHRQKTIYKTCHTIACQNSIPLQLYLDFSLVYIDSAMEVTARKAGTLQLLANFIS